MKNLSTVIDSLKDRIQVAKSDSDWYAELLENYIALDEKASIENMKALKKEADKAVCMLTKTLEDLESSKSSEREETWVAVRLGGGYSWDQAKQFDVSGTWEETKLMARGIMIALGEESGEVRLSHSKGFNNQGHYMRFADLTA